MHETSCFCDGSYSLQDLLLIIFALHHQMLPVKQDQSPVRIPRSWRPETMACDPGVRDSNPCENKCVLVTNPCLRCPAQTARFFLRLSKFKQHVFVVFFHTNIFDPGRPVFCLLQDLPCENHFLLVWFRLNTSVALVVCLVGWLLLLTAQECRMGRCCGGYTGCSETPGMPIQPESRATRDTQPPVSTGTQFSLHVERESCINVHCGLGIVVEWDDSPASCNCFAFTFEIFGDVFQLWKMLLTETRRTHSAWVLMWKKDWSRSMQFWIPSSHNTQKEEVQQFYQYPQFSTSSGKFLLYSLQAYVGYMDVRVL